MTDETEQGAPEPAPADAGGPDGAPRKRVAGFVVLFVVCVFVSLAGYRYAIDTVANDWYLFNVAKHTAWALHWIGDSSTLESRGALDHEDPRRVRAEIEAWRQGQEAPETPPADIAADPLTDWEVFRHRVLAYGRSMAQLERDIAEARQALDQATSDPGLDQAARQEALTRHNEALAELLKRQRIKRGHHPGPRVAFVWREGDREAESRIGAAMVALKQNAALSEAERQAQLAPLEREFAQARRVFFHFSVVPECGAIEAMAIFAAAILAFPTRWWKRLAGLAAGLPILYVVNIFRLTCLAVIGAWDQGGKWFNFSHHYVWQGIYIVFVVLVWMVWVEVLVREKTP